MLSRESSIWDLQRIHLLLYGCVIKVNLEFIMTISQFAVVQYVTVSLNLKAPEAESFGKALKL